VLPEGYGQDGRRRRRPVYGATKAAVLEKLDTVRQTSPVDMLVDASDITTGQFFGRWLDDVVRTTVGPRTDELYTLMVDHHILPRLGRLHLAQLSPLHVQGLLGEMERAGASPRLRQLAYDVLRRGLTQALRWDLVKRNVALGVVRPKAPLPEMRVLSPEEVHRFLEAARSDRLHALYVTALGTGMRQGELLGLLWENLDLTAACLHVRHQLQERSGQLMLAEPKSARSRRRIDLPAIVVRHCAITGWL
jgi:integrase